MKSLKINHLAVVAIVILGQVIPALWYGLFAEKWMEFNGLTPEEAMSGGATPYISSVVTSVVFAYVIAWLFRRMQVESAIDGLKTAVIMGIPFSLLNHMTTNFFSLRPYGLAWIEGGGELLIWAFAGLILGGWRKYEP